MLLTPADLTCFISPSAERPIVRRFGTRGKTRAGFMAPPAPLLPASFLHHGLIQFLMSFAARTCIFFSALGPSRGHHTTGDVTDAGFAPFEEDYFGCVRLPSLMTAFNSGLKTAIPHSMRRNVLIPTFALWPRTPTRMATETGNTTSSQT
jgi:hypothetical protein